MSDTDDNYIGVLLEEIRDQNKAVLEAVSDMQQHVVKLPTMGSGVERLQQDMQVVKAAVTDMSHTQQEHERRISRLEAA